MMQAPPGSGSSVRTVVVWRPRLSSARTAPVSRPACRPWACTRLLASVLLPAPLLPSSTSVRPGCSQAASAPAAAGWRRSSASAGMRAGRMSAASARRRAASAGSTVSALLSTSTAGTAANCTRAR